jgi:hypothetical protein
MGCGFFDQAAQQVVVKGKRFFLDIEPFTGSGRYALDGQQPVAIVVRVSLPCIFVELGHQAANGVTLEGGAALWPFGALAVADFVHPCQVPAQVVAKAPSQVVDALLFGQAVTGFLGRSSQHRHRRCQNKHLCQA